MCVCAGVGHAIIQGNGSRTRGNPWHGVSSEKDEAALECANLATLKRSAVQRHFTGRQRNSEVLLRNCSGGEARAGVWV